jgi:hypothetical protein
MLEQLRSGMAEVDWAANGPWLAVLLILLSGVALPAGLYALFDRWAARRLRIDTVALATRYGGFMNSWAVFGRHAGEYRDLRPLFPDAQAAELARFHDGTACIAARFRSEAAAQAAAEQRFASFAAAGVEYNDAGVSFQTVNAGEKRRGYVRGQWLVIGDTLFAFYGPDSETLARRRQAIPALRARRFPGPLRLLHSRSGYGLIAMLWIAAHLTVASLWLERTAHRAGDGAPVPAGELRLRLIALDGSGDLRLAIHRNPRGLTIAGRSDDLRLRDLGLLAGRDWITGLDLVIDAERSVVRALPLVGRSGAAERLGDSPAPPARWRNNALLLEDNDPLLQAVRNAVVAAGWDWQPVIWPALPRFDWALQWPWPRSDG